MFLKNIALAALSVHLLLGNLCMMPTAMAEEMPGMPGMDHDASATAPHGDQDNGSDGMPCDGEHCFAHALPVQESLSAEGTPTAAPPAMPAVVAPHFDNDVPRPLSAAPPGRFFHGETIVLRN